MIQIQYENMTLTIDGKVKGTSIYIARALGVDNMIEIYDVVQQAQVFEGEVSNVRINGSSFTTSSALMNSFNSLGGGSGSTSTTGRKRKAIIIAGQSNTVGWSGGQMTKLAQHTILNSGKFSLGNLDTRLKQIRRTNSANLVLSQAGIGNIDFQNGNSERIGYAYTLAQGILTELAEDEDLVIIPCAVGGTGWSDHRWSADGDLQEDLQVRIRYAVDNLGCEIIGAFWSQGETDASPSNEAHIQSISNVYTYLLQGLCQTIRDMAELSGQTNAQQIPFVTFDMVEQWVNSNGATARTVQNALMNLPNVMPYTGNADLSSLTADLDTDIVHYDLRQQLEIGRRMKTAWTQAKSNTNNLPNANFSKTLIFKQAYSGGNSNLFSNKYDALYRGNTASENLYSRLGELWKYRKNKKYRLRIEFTLRGDSTNAPKYIEWEQAYLPYFVVPMNSPASLIEANTPFGENNNTGFSGLTYYRGASFQSGGFLTMTTKDNWWTVVGQTQALGGIPMWVVDSVQQYTNELKLYVL